MQYNYKIKFKLKGAKNYIYSMILTIDADSNKKAQEIGRKKWQEKTESRARLQDAEIVKITCRKKETQPRARTTSPVNNALAVLNAYILEELSK